MTVNYIHLNLKCGSLCATMDSLAGKILDNKKISEHVNIR